jgi:hypothetical protein
MFKATSFHDKEPRCKEFMLLCNKLTKIKRKPTLNSPTIVIILCLMLSWAHKATSHNRFGYIHDLVENTVEQKISEQFL